MYLYHYLNNKCYFKTNFILSHFDQYNVTQSIKQQFSSLQITISQIWLVNTILSSLCNVIIKIFIM